MNRFLSVLEKYDIKYKDTLKRGELTTLQLNMGNLCNQSCRHCHVDASRRGKNVMSKKIVDDTIKFLSQNKIKMLDITGGAPELNPYFDYFIMQSCPFVDELIVRSNLTVFFEPGKEYLPGFFSKYKIHLACSLPCYREENVDSQRGKGVFKKSIEALKMLNALGYAKVDGLRLDLVYNPLVACLPPQQERLEKEYRLNLEKGYGISFNRLFTITNVPIRRFKNQLDSTGEYDSYVELLKDNFNPDTVGNLMCKNFLSVGYDGRLYDCDFNQALGWALKDEKGNILTIENVSAESFSEREIMVGEHCLSCTAGSGSSCQGALTETNDTHESVKEYYGRILKAKRDLKTSACCTGDSLPQHLRKIVKNIDEEITSKFYGCGLAIPAVLEGCRILDLGCGSGRDVYIASRLIGEDGFVIGVDMTDEQLAVALKHRESQMKRFGFSRSNVEFKKGYIENLKEIGIEDESQDVVISNCVINLSPDKEAVFREIFRVLKQGGELCFSDVFSDRRIPAHLKADPVLYGECLAGALYIEDFRRLLLKLGCPDYRVVSKAKIALNDLEIEKRIGGIEFYSMTIRVFKLADLEDRCEDYGQMAIYQGTISEHPHKFILDDHHIFIKGKPVAVCGNTSSMLSKTRLAGHFKVRGNPTTHYGLFVCSPVLIKDNTASDGCC